MGVTVQPGKSWSSTTPVKILDRPYFGGSGGFLGTTYDISLDGKQFLMIRAGGDQSTMPTSIVVVQHCPEELARTVK